jgi:3-oxoacyl-[acyl-carrier protein] reductase
VKYKLLITGGNGDLSNALYEELKDSYEVYTPTRNELDVTSIKSVNDYFIGKKFNIVINNAGTLYSSLVANSEPVKWINDINVNLIGTYLVSRAAINSDKSVILINVASTAAYNSYKDWSSYCSSKAGVLTFSHCLKNDGINVYCLCPGAIDTKLRNGLNISNKNIMTLSEAISPFLSVLNDEYNTGDVIFYRKGELVINP